MRHLQTDLARFTSAGVQTFLKETATATETSSTSAACAEAKALRREIATVMGTNSTPSENVAGRVRLMRMAMDCVTPMKSWAAPIQDDNYDSMPRSTTDPVLLDACGVCGGPGAVYECGCEDIPEGDCDCEGNQDDAIGVCGGDCAEDVNENDICDTDEQGCTDSSNPNYDPNAAFDDGSCFVAGCTFPSAYCDLTPTTSWWAHVISRVAPVARTLRHATSMLERPLTTACVTCQTSPTIATETA